LKGGNMSLDSTLKALFDLIRDEAKQNQDFRSRLENVLDAGELRRRSAPVGTDKRIGAMASSTEATAPPASKRGNRRPQALVDPIAESDHGEASLREKLAGLTLEQLRDVIADFRMDPSKLVMKWKDRERVINHIISTALNRRQKGDAFRA
jgi:hypothetical protein